MFDKMVESRSNPEQAKRSVGFFGTTLVLLSVFFLGIFVYSLFAKDLMSDLKGDGDELSTLVAPVPIPEEAPPPPQPEIKPEKQTVQEKPTTDNLPTRTDNIQRMDEAPTKPPDNTSVNKSSAKERPQGAFKLGDKNEDIPSGGPVGPARPDSGPSGPVGPKAPPAKVPPPEDDDKPPATPPPTPKPTPPPTPKPTPTPAPKPSGPVSGGVVNGKARSLVQPSYPPSAKAVGAKGQVSVQVLIDEAGNVVSASAVSGHPLLKAAAADAARRSKFSPTLLSGQPVKVSGTIIYNFQ